MGWLQPWPSSSFVLKLNTSTIRRTWNGNRHNFHLSQNSHVSHIHILSHIHSFTHMITLSLISHKNICQPFWHCCLSCPWTIVLFNTLTLSLYRTFVFAHSHTFDSFTHFSTKFYLFYIAAHLALVVLQHFYGQLFISHVFRCKVPDFTLKDTTFTAHPVHQDLLQGHLKICCDEIFQDFKDISWYFKDTLTSPPWALASVLGMSIIRFSSPAPFPAHIFQ